MADLPKSYLKPEEREGLKEEGWEEEDFYLLESTAASEAGDWDAAWEWLKQGQLPPEALMSMKLFHGSEYVREQGFDTTLADEEYGDDWLDK